MGFTIVKSVLKDIDAFPILTEEVGFAPSPVTKSGAAMPGALTTGSIGQVAYSAIADVLGWKVKDGDAKGFVGALTQSFTLTEVEGHVESKWTPRTYAVQSDLSGGITGAQASIYARAQDALNESLPLLNGLYTLDPEANQENIDALKSVARSQLTELVAELGLLGGPRVSRVNQYFGLLIGGSYPDDPNSDPQVEPGRPPRHPGLEFHKPGFCEYCNGRAEPFQFPHSLRLRNLAGAELDQQYQLLRAGFEDAVLRYAARAACAAAFGHCRIGGRSPIHSRFGIYRSGREADPAAQL